MAATIQIKSLEEIDKAAQEFIQYASSSPLQSNIFARVKYSISKQKCQ